MVFHPARRVAASHGVHDHSAHLVCLFFDWLHHLSCSRWREIFRIHRLARGSILSDTGLARSAGVRDAAVGHFNAYSRISSAMGPAQADRALDDSDLALRVCHRSSRLFNALPIVPFAGALTAITSAPQRITMRRTGSRWAEDSARYSDGSANHSDVKILRSTMI